MALVGKEDHRSIFAPLLYVPVPHLLTIVPVQHSRNSQGFANFVYRYRFELSAVATDFNRNSDELFVVQISEPLLYGH